MDVPKEYEGREQSFLKHRVLQEYLLSWGIKLGSAARRREVRLCYVDGFAGPWNARSDTLGDTSIAIGLDALETAATVWQRRGHKIRAEAFFVEKEQGPFNELEDYLAQRAGRIRTTAKKGEFGNLVPEITNWLGTDAGLIFVDPTGWKGAAMHFIAPLITGPSRRDVLVNVMFDHINRFKDDERGFLRRQMSDFFGLGESELPEGLREDELLALYRKKLKDHCRVDVAADIAIPHPTMDRTKFRLVVGGKNPAVVALFRDIEKRVIGREAAAVRDKAAAQRSLNRTGQMSLLSAPPDTDTHYESLHTKGLREAPGEILATVRAAGSTTFGEIWPPVLEKLHLTKQELAACGWELKKRASLLVENATPRQKTLNDDHILRVP